MEAILHFVMAHGTMVITSLLGAIIFCVFALLITSFHSPKDAVAVDIGSVDRLEGVLREMLSGQNWGKSPLAGSEGGQEQVSLLVEQVSGLEKELKEKQKMIDEMLNASPDEPTAAPLKIKIKELEEKLAEYSVIEEDIADLSKYRQENQDLRARITEATGMTPQDAISMPWEDFEKIVKDKKSISHNPKVTSTTVSISANTDIGSQGAQ